MLMIFLSSYAIASFNLAKSDAIDKFNLGKYQRYALKSIGLVILPFVLISLEDQTQLKLKFSQMSEIEMNIEAYSCVKMESAHFIRTELGLETTPQIAFSLILLLLSKSVTRTIPGIEAFDETSEKTDFLEEQSGLAIDSMYFIIMANLWTLFSTWRSYIRSMSLTKKHFPLVADLLLGLFVMISVAMKIGTILIYFTPCLGLFNVHRLYQGELMSYWAAMGPHRSFKYSVNTETDSVSFSNLTIPWSEFSRWNYSDPKNPERPSLTKYYTQFDLNTYFMIFWLILGAQAIVIVLVKKISHAKTFSKKKWNEVITHSLQNVWVQSPMEDWDEKHTSISFYKIRQKYNLIEMGCTLLVNLIFNVILQAPMWILGKFLLKMYFDINYKL